MSIALIQEFDYYRAHQSELLKLYNGKYVVIKGEAVLGAYDNASTAILETSKTHPKGTFLVQKCTPGDEAYTATFHSRVA
jgi:hypothetical protein